MRKGDFSQTVACELLRRRARSATTAHSTQRRRSATTAPPSTNGNIAAFLNPGAMALVNGTLPLPTRQQTGTDGYNYDQEDLVNNNVSQFAGRVDYAISPRNLFFARYSFEKGRTGQPLVPYYEPTSVMGEVNTPGYGVNNDIWVHCGAANYVTVFTPTLTNEFYLTVTSFVESFDARQIAACKSPLSAIPTTARSTTATRNIRSSAPTQPTAVCRSASGPTTRPIRFSSKSCSPTSATTSPKSGASTPSSSASSRRRRSTTRPRPIPPPTASSRTTTTAARAATSPTTTGPTPTARPPTAIRTSTAATRSPTSSKARSRTGTSRTSIPTPTSTSGTPTSTVRTPGASLTTSSRPTASA